MRAGPLLAGAVATLLALAGCAGAPEELDVPAGTGGQALSLPQPAEAVADSSAAASAAPSAASKAASPAQEPVSESPSVVAPSVGGAEEAAAAEGIGVAAGMEAGGEPSGATEAAASPPVPAAARGEPAREPGAVRYLSADDSNSQASPVVVRKLIRSGRYVQPAVVRTYEFLNYATFDYPPPTEGDLAIYAEMAPSAEQNRYSLQVTLRSRDRRRDELPPLRLTLLVDTSGSMAGAPVGLAGRFLLRLAERLRPGDAFAVVSCAREARVVVARHEVGEGTPRFLADSVIPSLVADDVTDLERGIHLAYEVAGDLYDARASNRVILISDGASNAGDMALETIRRYAEDSERQGIYLAGVGLGEGFNDWLMDRFTDAGRGAYLFLDREDEIRRALEDQRFVSSFDLALKDVRLKMVMPPGWQVAEFHGEQMSAVASEVVPQYLASSDQMIYHLEVSGSGAPEDAFTFEAEYRPIGGKPARSSVTVSVLDMLGAERGIVKANAIVAFAEFLHDVTFPPEASVERNLEALRGARELVDAAQKRLGDQELGELQELLELYGTTLRLGEQHPDSRDRAAVDPASVLGIPADAVRSARLEGPATDRAVAALSRLRSSERLVPLEGYRFLALGSGPVGNPRPEGSGQLSSRAFENPAPRYLGNRVLAPEGRQVYDLHRVRLELEAPSWARSFSFDFNFFSAEYPDYVGQSYNDTFYAVLESPSTNGGETTNIAFDAEGASIEVDNNYFQKPFHPIPNQGTGFDRNGSTGWLRTSWPIGGGEPFTLTFSVHDEGDAVYDSLVLLDNFRFHEHTAVGNTDPLN